MKIDLTEWRQLSGLDESDRWSDIVARVRLGDPEAKAHAQDVFYRHNPYKPSALSVVKKGFDTAELSTLLRMFLNKYLPEGRPWSVDEPFMQGNQAILFRGAEGVIGSVRVSSVDRARDQGWRTITAYFILERLLAGSDLERRLRPVADSAAQTRDGVYLDWRFDLPTESSPLDFIRAFAHRLTGR